MPEAHPTRFVANNTKGHLLFRKQWTWLESNLTRLGQLLDHLDRRSEKLETILMLREPASVTSADAYDGLRKQVVAAVSARQAHLSQLVQIDVMLQHGADTAMLAKVVPDWLEQAGLKKVTRPDQGDADLLFELVEDLGGELEVLAPAYVDDATGRVIRQGRARRAEPPAERDARPAAATEGKK
jgi:hypothetical protein